MSTKRKNGEVTATETAEHETQTWDERRKPQPRMVKDPLTGETRLENKREKFVRLAEHRMNNALKRLRQIKALGNRNQYGYDDSDANKILEALNQAVGEIKVAFAGGKAVVKGFKL